MSSASNICASDSYGVENVQEFVAHLIRACGAKKTDHITIVGRRAIQTVADLCRRGYVHVMWRSAVRGPHVSENAADSLCILNVPSEAELLTFIATLSTDLRMSGTLVVGYEVSISSAHASRLKRVLLEKGFGPVRYQTDTAGRTFLTCGRRDACTYAQAA